MSSFHLLLSISNLAGKGQKMASDNLKKGKEGEALAEKFLKKKGYKILQRNFRTRFGEIDIIALDNKTLVFVEVKARSAEAYGSPMAAVNAKKQLHLTHAANIYMEEHCVGDRALRFDVVGILGYGRTAKIELIQNAFDAVE